jgi:ClpP class serine protease
MSDARSTPTRRPIRSGEPLAIAPGYAHSLGAEMWWDLGPAVPENVTEGTVTTVYLRGVMDHHEGFGDSYDALVKRWGEACNDGGRTLALRIDSPGGVVSGLSECVEELSVRAREAGCKTVAYVDGMATSAAFALACSCQEIVCPRSAILGSIGVISTMTSYAEANAQNGVQVVTITSGECKADGHPDSPITDAALARERARVEKFASQFFRLAGRARGLDPEDLRAYQAGLFVGSDAVRAGLADAIMSWRELVAILTDAR